MQHMATDSFQKKFILVISWIYSTRFPVLGHWCTRLQTISLPGWSWCNLFWFLQQFFYYQDWILGTTPCMETFAIFWCGWWIFYSSMEWHSCSHSRGKRFFGGTSALSFQRFWLPTCYCKGQPTLLGRINWKNSSWRWRLMVDRTFSNMERSKIQSMCACSSISFYLPHQWLLTPVGTYRHTLALSSWRVAHP